MERFDMQIRMYGRTLRIDEYDDVYSLREYKGNPKWTKLKFNSKVVGAGYVTRISAPMDRFNQTHNPRGKSGDFNPRPIPYPLLLAIKYLSNGEDLGFKGYYVSHKNGDVLDNRIENLEWIKRDKFFKERISISPEIGSKMGLWTILENVRVPSRSSQYNYEFFKTYSKARCCCGYEELINPVQLRRCNTKKCCSNCLSMYGRRLINRVLMKYGLLKVIGKANSGRKKYELSMMPPDFDMTEIISELNKNCQ